VARPTLLDSVENINNRRSQVLLLLAEGKTLSQISQILKVPISTITEDNNYIKRQGLKFLGNISKQELSYHFYVSMNTIELVKYEALQIFKDKDNVSTKDRLRALQIVLQSNSNKDQLALNASKVFAWEELAHKVELLHDTIDVSNNQDSQQEKLSDILNKDMLLDKTIKIKSKDIDTNNQLTDKTNNNKTKDKIKSNNISNNGNNNNNKTNNKNKDNKV
jgi:hypothetical protein